ncbi:MAG: CcdB family protein [Sulfurimicrobium sp.]|jgi:toxin CcdB|nr:CcdB family protein [Sulfurimicrobium sp.]
MGNKSAKHLNPGVEIHGEKLVLLTHELAAVPTRILGMPIASLKHKHAEIIQALDMVFSGV